MKERWKTIKDYPDYAVSDHGRVKRITPGASRACPGKVLKSPVNSHGYRQIGVYRDKKRKVFRVHGLVASAFIGNRPIGLTVNHIDGNKLNNNASNLEYCTPSENMNHALALGLISHKGERNPTAKLTEGNVVDIRKLWKTGKYTQREIGQMFHVVRTTIGLIVTRKRWSHI